MGGHKIGEEMADVLESQRVSGIFTRDPIGSTIRTFMQTGAISLKYNTKGICDSSSRLQALCQKRALPEITKSKIRSITLTASILPIYNVGRRAGPPRIETAYVENYQEVQDSKPKNHYLASYSMSDHENQSISSWTGLNIKIRRDIAVVQDTFYLETLRDEHNLSAFWMSYLDMVEIMLDLVRASREGNWMLHLGQSDR
ncbi:hypothetical protein GWK47_005209 [Chionoecetes opilio]|uniref:Uncharacterized protein n=1 Tax=Chionoecetes opilio TaxID=41210 RepID=A0A8J5CZQ5_CHIOP|nr:hypothetical protein GWK47_005209 [Chionoecetes opilio]